VFYDHAYLAPNVVLKSFYQTPTLSAVHVLIHVRT